MGIVFIFITFLAFMNALYTFGMDSALLKYYQSESNILFTSFVGIFIFALPISLIIYINGNYLETILFQNILSTDSWILKNEIWILFAIIILILDAVSSRAMTLIRILNMPRYYLIIAMLNIFSSLILNIYFLYFVEPSWKLDGVIVSMFIVSIIQCVSLMPIVIKKLNSCLILKFSTYSIIYLF